jgi:hypothetical protein
VRDGVGDPLLSLLLSGALLLFLRYRTTGRRGWLVAACCAAALSSLLKGALGPLLLAVILSVWELVREEVLPPASAVPPGAVRGLAPGSGQETGVGGAVAAGAGATGKGGRWLGRAWDRLRAPLAVAGLGIVPYLAWSLDTVRRRESFLAYEHRDLYLRITRGLASSHVHGAFFYPGVLREAFGHWWWAILPAVLGWSEVRRRGGPRARAFLLLPIWVGAVFMVLSLSVSKLGWYAEPTYPAIAVLLAAGCGEIGRRLGRWPVVRIAFALLLAVLVGARARWAWETVTRDQALGQMHRFVLAYRQLPHPHLYIGDLRPGGRLFQEWNYFYLHQLADLAQPLPRSLPAGCNVVVAGAPDGPGVDFGQARALILPLAKELPEESDVQIVDLCDGQLVRRLPGWS